MRMLSVSVYMWGAKGVTRLVWSLVAAPQRAAAPGNWVMWRWRGDEVASPSGSRQLKGDRRPCLSWVSAWQWELSWVFAHMRACLRVRVSPHVYYAYVKGKKVVGLGGLKLDYRQRNKRDLIFQRTVIMRCTCVFSPGQRWRIYAPGFCFHPSLSNLCNCFQVSDLTAFCRRCFGCSHMFKLQCSLKRCGLVGCINIQHRGATCTPLYLSDTMGLSLFFKPEVHICFTLI